MLFTDTYNFQQDHLYLKTSIKYLSLDRGIDKGLAEKLLAKFHFWLLVSKVGIW